VGTAGAGWSIRAVVGGEAAEDVVGAGETVALRVELDAPRLWWPRGLGAQPLYDVRVQLRDPNGRVVTEHETRVGFRSLALDTEPDEEGTPFTFEINGVNLPIRGVNWIPDDCFPSRITEERLRERLAQAADANVNLLRVWGGGIYESDTFYGICDELGLLVWQDFLFACAAYPEDEKLAAEIEAEARDNVQRLREHPSLVLWNGNNENIWGWFDWDWQPRLGDRGWGLTYYLKTLPAIVAELDPSRPYWPGSPYSGTMSVHPNAPAHALTHIWDVWNDVDYTVYREYRPRFASEFGWQAPPTWSTITASIRDEPLTQTSAGMLHHQKAHDGNGKLERGLSRHFAVPDDFTHWHFAMQLNQARAIRLGVEHFRSLRPLNSGTIVWQLNDCWPVTSWSAIDGYGRKKPVWYALRAAYAPRLLTMQPRGDGLVLAVTNDGGDAWREPFTARRVRFDGTVLATHTSRFAVDRFSGTTLPLPDDIARPDSAAEEVVEVVTGAGARALWFFAEDRDLAYEAPRMTVSVGRTGGGVVEVDVTAHVLMRDVTLFPDRLAPEAESDSALVTLLPGQRHVFRVVGVPEGREEQLSRHPVLCSANDLVTR
jgi:beta-mannosidase